MALTPDSAKFFGVSKQAFVAQGDGFLNHLRVVLGRMLDRQICLAAERFQVGFILVRDVLQSLQGSLFWRWA